MVKTTRRCYEEAYINLITTIISVLPRRIEDPCGVFVLYGTLNYA